MTLSTRSRFVRTVQWLPALGAGAGLLAGSLGLLGWALGVPALQGLVPGLVAMNPLTAACLVLGSSSLLLLRHGATPLHQRLGMVLTALVCFGAGLKLLDLSLGTDFHPDQWLFPARLDGDGSIQPNRMAPNTAVALACLGLSLTLLRLRRNRTSQLVVLVPLGISLLAILGYVLDAQGLYGVRAFIPMALNTALALWCVSIGVFFARPGEGLTRILLCDDAGGVLARRVMPAALALPLVLAWLRTHAARAGLLATEESVPVMVLVSVAATSVFIWLTAIRLSRADGERKEAILALEAAQRELEARVHARTFELEERTRQLEAEVEDRRRTEARLGESELRYRLLFHGNPHPMWVYSRDSLRFLAVNEAAVALYGYAEAEFLQMTIRDIRPPEDVPALTSFIASTEPQASTAGEWRHRRKDGSTIDVAISSHPLPFGGSDAMLVLAQDVTGRKHLEAQLRQAQKMEAVGQLAGGVAHDFNNLLTAILGYSQLLRSRLSADPRSELVGHAVEIEKAGMRAAGLTRQLLAFSRQQVLQPKVLDLNEAILDMDKMLRRLLNADIELQTVPAPVLSRVKADPGQIEQVILNLVVNARDAMPDGGQLTIETANVYLDGSQLRGREDLTPGPFVMLAISDNGVGMDESVRARIFEPFYTTKEVGRGTGLGLSTVHGIVKQSGGHIEAYSELGKGTTFKVYLPEVDAPLDNQRTGPRDLAVRGGTETILVVEDDEIVRTMIVRTLREAGYHVLEAMRRDEALAICRTFREDRVPVDLMLSDVVMPGMSIAELAAELRSLQPDLKVVYMSGYTDKSVTRQGLLDSADSFIQKPFAGPTLLATLRTVLDDGQSVAA